MSPVDFSKRPLSAVANYPFHGPTSRGKKELVYFFCYIIPFSATQQLCFADLFLCSQLYNSFADLFLRGQLYNSILPYQNFGIFNIQLECTTAAANTSWFAMTEGKGVLYRPSASRNCRLVAKYLTYILLLSRCFLLLWTKGGWVTYV